MSRKRMTIIGAGPIGLEAALYALALGYEVDVFEKDQVGGNILKWGHVSLFSPWKMNHSILGPALLKKHLPSWHEPEPDKFFTGRDYVEAYLIPLSKLPHLTNKIHTGVKVLSIGRNRVMKGDLIGDHKRTSFQFRILTSDSKANEKYYDADYVLDASGVYDNPNWLGDGGIPALGELKSKPFIDYHISDIYGEDRARFAGKKALLIGAGYSAATTVCDFQNLIREEPSTSLLWVIREERTVPIPVIENDQLENRAKLTEQANSIVQNTTPAIEFRNNTTVESVEYSEQNDHFSVGLKQNNGVERMTVDRVIANVGYGPDNSIYRELQVHECYASRGPMKLAAALLGSSSSADCLAQQSMGADTLKNPEPNFFIIGNKSYGRNSTFLIRIGLSQIAEVFSLITGDEDLNLYKNLQTENERLVS